jgi:hypothetical protein
VINSLKKYVAKVKNRFTFNNFFGRFIKELKIIELFAIMQFTAGVTIFL